MNAGPKRMVHQTLWASGQVSRLSRDARLLYVGLITLGDDDGRLKGSATLLRSQIYPYDDDVKVADVAKLLSEIEAQKLIIKYEIEGESYYFHPKWEEYQHIREDRRRESHIPAPDIEFIPMATKRQPTGNQVVDKVRPNISKYNISKDNINQDVAFQGFWLKYPNKKAKKAAYRAWSKIKWSAELAKAIMEGLERASKSDQWVKDNGRYIPHAATWLNGERWEDEMKVGKPRNNKYDNVGNTA